MLKKNKKHMKIELYESVTYHAERQEFFDAVILAFDELFLVC